MSEEPQFTADKADVVIYDRRSGIVTTVADWNLSIPEAGLLADRLLFSLSSRFNCALVDTGSVNIGSVIAEPENIPMPPPPQTQSA